MLHEDDVAVFLHGACHVFALALHQRFGYPMFLLRDLRAADQKSAAHVYCRFSDSDSVDVVGIAPENLALAELGWSGPNYLRMETSPKKLQSFFTLVGGGGLYADPEFLNLTRARAKTRIDIYRDYYDGAIPTAIPGATRTRRASPQETQEIFEP